MRRIPLIPLAVLSLAALVLQQYLIYYYAPLEQTMREAQKIFYMHVPLAWWGLFSFFLVFLASITVLVKKGNSAGAARADCLAGAAAETGLLMATLSLLSGSIWARSSWNTWWDWDPRLTTTLIMWFIYAGYLVLRRIDLPVAKRRTAAAVLGIVAFLDVPLVFFSARLWKSYLHPSVFTDGKPTGLEPEMLHTLLAGIAAFGLLWLCLTVARNRQLLLHRELEQSRLRAAESWGE